MHAGPTATLYGHNPLFRMLGKIAAAYRAGDNLPEVWDAGEQFGVLGITGPHNDPHENDDGEYIRVGFVLPDDIYAEVDDGTYGQLNAFRIYRENL